MKLFKKQDDSNNYIIKLPNTLRYLLAWDIIKDRFTNMRNFCGGLAMAFANTTMVESNFSILKWGKKKTNFTTLTNLSLEGISNPNNTTYF
jgi:hypothetical protein